jgi:hypothetical protein
MPLSRKRLSRVLRTVIIVAVISAVSGVSYPLYRKYEWRIRLFLRLPPPPDVSSFDIGQYHLKSVIRGTGYGDILISGPADFWKREGGCFATYEFYTEHFLLPGEDMSNYPKTVKPILSSDINNDGWPEVVITERRIRGPDSTSLFVVRLGEKIDCVFELADVYHDGLIVVRDEDGDGIMEIRVFNQVIEDWYWGKVLVHAFVVYKWRDGAYHMVAPEPDSKYEATIDKNTRNCLALLDKAGGTKPGNTLGPMDDPMELMCQIMVDYIYAGEGVKAREAFDRLWPAKMEGKDEALIKFDRFLRKGRFWNEINAGTAPEKRWPGVRRGEQVRRE